MLPCAVAQGTCSSSQLQDLSDFFDRSHGHVPSLAALCTLLQLTLVAMCVCSADVKNTQTTGPVLIHVITDKGRGYDPAVSASDRMHGVGKFDKATGKQFKTKSKVSLPVFVVGVAQP